METDLPRGWALVPVELDRPARMLPADAEGREPAFAATTPAARKRGAP